MCVIIVKDNDKMIDNKTLIAASIINPDGLGVLWLDTYKVDKIPSAEYKVLRTKRPFIAHFRYATVGKINLGNCHPFSIDNDSLLFQNGTIKNLGNKKQTDTQHMAEILGRCDRRDWRDILEQSDCRFVVANRKTRKYSLYNEMEWIERNGILYSKQNVLDLEFLAVYGTLKYRASNYFSYLQQSEYLGEAETVNKHPLIIDGLPYLLSKKGEGHHVDVDVFLVSKRTMEDVDQLEGHPQWYKRKKTKVKLKETGDVVSAWTYFNDTIEDSGVYHKSYETMRESVYTSWYDTYDIEDYMGKSTKQCLECCNDLSYDSWEGSHYCMHCNEYEKA